MKVNQSNVRLRTAAERQRHNGEFKMKFRNTTGNEKVRDKEVQKGDGGGRSGVVGAGKEIWRGRWAGQSGGDKGKKDAAQISISI